ncbi:hypothetical protein ASPZODRAFT_13835 [Penicilliopsis zonata CBS 506.65]|uniref:SGNH hydrolase-type esterase domain-containing protein n=1 Tax=Penicilliopsis zonata CBS 506.65 TaxID=1073090 RepID=A0A1L9SPJ6_9EURO|nr:hypothetical protein ASPZODRAFT_13835 [Penicilliopsis zonata CBS 506.65]OJJ49098.1 hypothetical protein ASPZODRAFT_13835 [Penicilliopsis zonata CBS 506.65]
MDPISILCFGNSLTAGYFHFGLEYHPYALRFKERLQAAFPSQAFTVDVEGLSGDLVITPPGCYLARMQARFSSKTYDWVICLGGTNDLGYGYDSSKIFTGLQASWNVALSHGARVLALTIPECEVVNKVLDRRRNEVNAAILAHQAEGFYSFDLHAKVPFHSMSEEQRSDIWDDGLHLTDIGYDLVGDLVAEHLVKLLE